MFASNVSVSRAYTHIVQIGRTVEIGGLSIHSVDLLHGDLHRVQSIPLNIAAQLPDVAAEIKLKEAALVALCRLPELSLENLRTAVECGSA